MYPLKIEVTDFSFSQRKLVYALVYPQNVAEAMVNSKLRLTSNLLVLRLQSLRSHASAVRFGNKASCVLQYSYCTKSSRDVSIGFSELFR